MTTRPTRRAVHVVAVVLLAVVAGYGLYWYAPWTRLTDTTVDDALTSGVADAAPAPDLTHTADTGPYRISTGTFISQRHTTSGRAQIVRMPGRNPGLRLELIDLDTANGPDLRVWLSDQPVKADEPGWRVFETGRRVELGKLRGNKGNQVYDIPAAVALTNLRTVTIWSGRFSVSYGAAALS